MHQFGHIYALQREMSKTSNSWFRAAELWHIARNEGVPYSSYNYAHILRMCNRDKQWHQALLIHAQMRQEGITFETDCAEQVLAACARCNAWQQVLSLYEEMKVLGVFLNDFCRLSIIKALRMKLQSDSNAYEIVCKEATCVLESHRMHEPSLLLEGESRALLEELPHTCDGREALFHLISVDKQAAEEQHALPMPD